MGKLRMGPESFDKVSLYEDIPIISTNSATTTVPTKALEKIVYVEKPIEVIKEIEKIVEKEVFVDKRVEIPVETIKEVEVIKVMDREVEVPVPYYIEKIKNVYKVSKWAQLTILVQGLLIVGLIISHII